LALLRFVMLSYSSSGCAQGVFVIEAPLSLNFRCAVHYGEHDTVSAGRKS
jgi:hypothetical protein